MVRQIQQQFGQRRKVTTMLWGFGDSVQSQSGHAKDSKKQFLSDSYYKMMHRLYQEPGKDIVGIFDNAADIKIKLCQKKKKNDNPKTNKQ